MNYDLNEEQVMLKDTARRFLAGECNGDFIKEMKEDPRGYTDGLWNKMAELGWMCILVPEAYGGIGGSVLDMAVLVREMGYSCLPGPFFSTAVTGVIALLEGGSEEQKQQILPGVATGEKKLSLAWLEEDGSNTARGIRMTAEKKGSEYVLNGKKLFVKDANVADTLIVVAREPGTTGEEGITLLLVDAKAPGITMAPLHVMSGEKQSEVIFSNARIPAGDVLGKAGAGWPVFKRVVLQCAVLRSAEMAGGAEKVLEVTSAYAKERVQFGKPIGAFQAVAHHCANMWTESDTSNLLMYQAAWRISAGMDYEREATICKAFVSDAYCRLLKLGAEVLGGTGFCEEHDFHLYAERGKSAELDFGDGDFHRELWAQAMGL
jgi:alkylation response protein AidB-like acyl-CoA dehydrogenase